MACFVPYPLRSRRIHAALTDGQLTGLGTLLLAAMASDVIVASLSIVTHIFPSFIFVAAF